MYILFSGPAAEIVHTAAAPAPDPALGPGPGIRSELLRTLAMRYQITWISVKITKPVCTVTVGMCCHGLGISMLAGLRESLYHVYLLPVDIQKAKLQL